MSDSYKIADHYQDIPLDLTHYLIMRTREYLLLKNRVSEKATDENFLLPNMRKLNVSQLKECKTDLEVGL